MFSLLKTNLGRLRVVGFLEGISYLLLLFIAMPAKYWGDNPMLVKVLGPIHGALFVLFVLIAFSVAADQKWKFGTTLKVLVSSIIPFGTFYVDKKILRPVQES